ncbi:Qat anti-phage system associated protein QatB [Membranihabitans maritimus]|uniref:Qat anti-phage system associated protein QatB n=1 Tax=Membranihabitans maritimus TaxID=2904244 RepID=UPI001F21791A|nr:Qat anti-phage system associated protein QatB [Membranihabitans maritimus]
MGTSSSGSGPKGRTPLLPNWATAGGDMPDKDDNQNQEDNSQGDDESDDGKQSDNGIGDRYADSLKTAKGALKRIVNGRYGATFKKAAKTYVKRTGGHKSATRASNAGISAGRNYLGFFSGVASSGIEQILRDYDLADCIGKPTEEVFARIANKIAPDGSTNDEAIARTAVMMAFDKLCQKLIENDQDITALDRLDENTLKDTVIEFVSAYIFKKWVYEAGLALERNDLSEAEAIALENEMKDFVTGEVKSGLGKMDMLTLDITQGKGKQIIQNIFDLAYSTLEK